MSPDQIEQAGERTRTYGVSVVVALLIIVGLGGWFAYYTLHTQPIVDQTLREQFVWQITPGQPLEDKPGPRTNVSLQIAGAELPAGTYPGNCAIIDGKSAQLLANELSGVICRSGESGVEIGIFRENDKLVLKRGDITGASARGENFSAIVNPS